MTTDRAGPPLPIVPPAKEKIERQPQAASQQNEKQMTEMPSFVDCNDKWRVSAAMSAVASGVFFMHWHCIPIDDDGAKSK